MKGKATKATSFVTVAFLGAKKTGLKLTQQVQQ